MSARLIRCRHADCTKYASYLLSMGTGREFLHLCPRHARLFRAASYHEVLRVYAHSQSLRREY